MQRRSFLYRAALILVSVAGTIAGLSIIRIVSKGSGGKRNKLKIGELSEFPLDAYTLIGEEGIYIYRDHEGVKAVSAICTHLGCTVQRTDEGFECPCHGTCYAEDGRVLSGPAPRPLAWYGLERRADGGLQVDLDQEKDAGYKFLLA